jgi:hypothetical protein
MARQEGAHNFANGKELEEKYGFNPQRLFIDVPCSTFFGEAFEAHGDPVLLDLVCLPDGDCSFVYTCASDLDRMIAPAARIQYMYIAYT